MTVNVFLAPFLAVQASFWPLLISLDLFSLIVNIVLFINFNVSFYVLLFSQILLLLIMFLWWNDLSRESIVGYHTHKLELSLRLGMLLFILSEVFFFFSFFWAFFDAALIPTVELGIVWPPNGVVALSPFSVPLLNTCILLASGVTVTWAHHALVHNYYFKSLFSLAVTVILGVYFLIMQGLEYSEAQFALSDGVYGSTFFVATGFHGMHVTVGTIFLFYVFLSLLDGKLLFNHHFSFEAAAWYWHFVDVVWLFLFLSIYCWAY